MNSTLQYQHSLITKLNAIEPAKNATEAPAIDSFAASLLTAMLRDAAEKQEVDPPAPSRTLGRAAAPKEKEKKPAEPRQPGAIVRFLASFFGVRKRPEKQLRVSETVALGEKRFVAVLQCEGRKFLIGGGSAGVSLLTSLDSALDSGLNSGLNPLEALQPARCAGERFQ